MSENQRYPELKAGDVAQRCEEANLTVNGFKATRYAAISAVLPCNSSGQMQLAFWTRSNDAAANSNPAQNKGP